jgi:predicted ATP-grasp superfamily ATP-dependent carboligase
MSEAADFESVDDVLAFDAEQLPPLDRPVLLVALTGWFDVAAAATDALDHVAPRGTSLTVGAIDPDPFYDFTQERPEIEIDEGTIQVVHWPANEFRVVRAVGTHDLVVLSGVEPHLGYRTFARCITRVAEATRCDVVVTVGSVADAVPHTRTPPVVGSTADPDLARRLGLSAPTYEGVTGLIGVLHAELEQRSIPTISLRVGVPHYLAHAEHPQATAALLDHLGHVLGFRVDYDLAEPIERWGALHDEAVAEDEQLRMYVRVLEVEHDRRAEAAIPSADDLGDEFERFLRERGDDDPGN